MQGNTCELTLEVAFINVDDPTDRDVQVFPGLGADYGDKATGKAASYAYKLALLKAFMLESSDEDNEKGDLRRGPKLGAPGDNGQLPPDPEELAAELMESLAKARTHQQVDAVKKEVVKAKKKQLLQPKIIEALVKMGQKRREELGSPKEQNGANADWLALAGDASDNITGCPKVGPGKATDLLQLFGDIEEIKRRAADDPAAILAVPGIGKTVLFSIQEWDPTTDISMATLMSDAPVSLEHLWDADDAREPDDENLF
jgi:hypothetical protein